MWLVLILVGCHWITRVRVGELPAYSKYLLPYFIQHLVRFSGLTVWFVCSCCIMRVHYDGINVVEAAAFNAPIKDPLCLKFYTTLRLLVLKR